ncbi:YaiI/YqxD family protein, partial [Mesorhizobium sp. M7A.F.Ca.ET.027.03.2.1]
MSELPAILVDADACPVKAEVEKVADRHGILVTYVSNGGLRPSRDPMIRNVVVSKGADAADDWIVDNARTNDIVITADIPLAARAVALGAHVLGPTGRPFTPETIGMAVAMRDLKQH